MEQDNFVSFAIKLQAFTSALQELCSYLDEFNSQIKNVNLKS